MPKPILFLIAVLFLRDLAVADLRTWTDGTGQRHVEAEYLMSHAGKVWVCRRDGRVFQVPLTELSEADRQYVSQLVGQKEAKGRAAFDGDPERIRYGPPRQLAELANPSIVESSGLACSRTAPGLFWTHNDSDSEPRIYLFDSQGRDLGSCLLAGAPAYDWEDMASFTWKGKHYLLLGDVGNNDLGPFAQILHLVEEPGVDPRRGLTVREIPLVKSISFSYEDEPRNCEAVAVDPADRTVLLATKEFALKCYVYTLPWPSDEPGKTQPSKKALVARLIATLKIPLVTAMDVSPDGRRAILLTYANAYEFVREHEEGWPAAFAREPREIVMPPRVQGESICYGPDGKTLYLTSEKRPTPLWEVPPAALERERSGP
jgi:hypothetical protein